MFSIAFKDLKIFIRDRKALLLTFLLPIALITLFTIAYGGLFGKSQPQPEYLLINDQDSSTFSAKLIGLLDKIDGMALQSTDTAAGKNLIRSGKRLAMLHLGEGLEQASETGSALPITLFFDEGRRIEAGMLQEVLLSRLAPVLEEKRNAQRIRTFMIQRYAMLGPDMVEELSGDVTEFMQEGESQGALISPVPLAGREGINWGLIQAVAGVAVMMLLFSVAAIGSSIIEEKEEGTLKRLQTSPLPSWQILAGKQISALAIAITQLVIMFLFGWLAFGLDIWMNPLGLGINIFATALACSSFGIFLAAISRSRKQVESLSTIVILIMSAIGGSMIPLFLMPKFMHTLAMFSVNYWSIDAFFDILARDAATLTILWKSGVLIGMSALLMFTSLHFFRKSLRQINT